MVSESNSGKKANQIIWQEPRWL